MSSRRHFSSGFTLIELLLVIAIIAVLASITIIAINPARQLAQSNNAQRRSNVNTILNAISQYTIDEFGVIPSSISTTAVQVCRTNAVSTSSCTDLSVLTADELYISSIPEDPTVASGNNTGYTVRKTTSSNPRVIVNSPAAELGETISVTR